MLLANVKIRLTYSRFYQCGTSFNKILPKKISENFLLLLSAISYDSCIYQVYKEYCIKNFCSTKKRDEQLKNGELLEPRTSYIAWKLIFSRSEIIKDNTIDFQIIAKQLFDFLLKINDVLDDEDKKVLKKDTTQYVEHLFLENYQDNVCYQFYRTQNIFIDSEKLIPYILSFEKQNLVELKKYFYICHRILVRYNNICQINTNGMEDKFQFLNYWKTNSINIAEETTFKIQDILKVVECISRTPEEIKKEFNNQLDNILNSSKIDIFKNFPFIKLNNMIIPINNILSENLIFTNLFYKISDSNKKISSEFRSSFGYEFEKYVYNLAEMIKEFGNRDCIIEKEFTYKINKKGEECKSPDLMLIYPDKKQVIVFEVKGAQILNAFNKDYKDKISYTNSIKKTIYTPLLQSVKSIKKIIECNATKLFDESYNFIFVAVSMNGFPIYNFKINVDYGNTTKDFTQRFFFYVHRIL